MKTLTAQLPETLFISRKERKERKEKLFYKKNQLPGNSSLFLCALCVFARDF
jgi:hypothetical protein